MPLRTKYQICKSRKNNADLRSDVRNDIFSINVFFCLFLMLTTEATSEYVSE